MRKPYPMCRSKEEFYYPPWRQPVGPFIPKPAPFTSMYAPQSTPGAWVPPFTPATELPASLADQVDPTEDTMAYTTACKGWIAVKTYYHGFDHIAVSGEVKIYKVEDDAETLVRTENVEYKTVAQSVDDFTPIPLPQPRPSEIPEQQPMNMRSVELPEERPSDVPQSAPAYEDDSFPIELDIDDVSSPQPLYQAPEVAKENGNPSLIFGGEEGFDPGNYLIKFKPKIRHGKLRIDPEPLNAGDGAGMAGRYVIIPGHGAPSNEHTTSNTTDQYLQVSDNTTVEEEWTQRIVVGCSKPEIPSVAEFVWTDFKAWSETVDRRARTLHPLFRHRVFCFINKAEELDDGTHTIGKDAFRAPIKQDELYCNNSVGNSNKRSYCEQLGLLNNGDLLSNAKRWQSMHCYGLAIDTYNIEGSSIVERSEFFGRTIAGSFGLEWGISFGDPPHFSWPSERSWRQYINHVNDGLSELNTNSRFEYNGGVFLKDEFI